MHVKNVCMSVRGPTVCAQHRINSAMTVWSRSYYILNARTEVRFDIVVDVGVLQDNMKALHDQWRQLDAKHREPYERAAAADANRYRREV